MVSVHIALEAFSEQSKFYNFKRMMIAQTDEIEIENGGRAQETLLLKFVGMRN